MSVFGIRRRMPRWKLLRAREMRRAPTPAEARLWEALRCHRLGVKFRRQALVLGYIVDFYCPAARLIVELDGAAHENRAAFDAHRDAALARAGIATLRFPNRLVFQNLPSVLVAIRHAVVPRLSRAKTTTNSRKLDTSSAPTP